jgi:hypothetical protein
MNKVFGKPTGAGQTRGRRRLALEPLEERILLSVDLIPYAPDAQEDEAVHYERQIDSDRAAPETTEQTVDETTARELVLIDSGVGDTDALQKALEQIGFGATDLKSVVIIDSREDAIAALSGGVNYDAVHWISHGTSGGFRLGDGFLDAQIDGSDPLIETLIWPTVVCHNDWQF